MSTLRTSTAERLPSASLYHTLGTHSRRHISTAEAADKLDWPQLPTARAQLDCRCFACQLSPGYRTFEAQGMAARFLKFCCSLQHASQ